MAKTIPTPRPLFDTLINIDETYLPRDITTPYASNDFDASKSFLKQYDGSEATFNTYRREIERAIQWSWLVANKGLVQLNREDLETYIHFCLKPPKRWIGLQQERRFINRGGERITNPKWRPFVATLSKAGFKRGETADKNTYQLSQQAISDIFKVLSSFYNYLVYQNLVDTNPVALIRQKSKFIQKRQGKASIKRLSEEQWQFCIDATTELADKKPEVHERSLFIISALYSLYLRISELAASPRWTPEMSDFMQDSNKNWWFRTVGKGNKMRDIAVSDQMLSALKRWRQCLNLSPLPSLGETSPLVTKARGPGAIESTRQIRNIVQTCFDAAAKNLYKAGKRDEAKSLQLATVHWLRHTGISDDINKRNRPIAHVRDDAGHSTSATTDRYNDIELRERHQSAKDKEISS